jgi:capsular exopolysaccharide synthesis family protein
MTSEFGTAPNLRSYALLVRRRKWWVAGLALAGLGVSLALAFTEAKQYSATAQVLVQAVGGPSSLAAPPQSVTPTVVQTELLLVTSAQVKSTVSRKLGAAPPGVSAAEVAQTNVIAITATAAKPAQAARIANTYASAFVAYQRTVTFRSLTAAELQLRTQIKALGKQITKLHGTSGGASQITALVNQEVVLKEQLAQMQVNGSVATGGLELVTPAQAPTSPSTPKPAQDGLLGLAAGLVLGLAAAFLRDNLDDAVATKDAAEHLAGAPTLAMVPMVASWKRRDKPVVVASAKPTAPAAEAYRSLRTSLQFVQQERDLRTILVTSPAASEGKTSTLANLGAVFAQAGQPTVLVSCDLRRPRLGKFFGLSEQVGLTTVLFGEASLDQAVQAVPGYDSLCVLAAGALPNNPAELLSSAAARQLFAGLRQRFSLVLIDSPPLLPVTDAVILSKVADATLLVVAAGQTRRGDLQRAAEKLAQVNATVVGLVLNEVTRQNGYGQGYGAGYGYGYGSYASEVPLANVPVPANGKAADVSVIASKHGRRGR